MERDPTKRRVKPAAQALIDFDDLGESSDDSDFRIEDHTEESDDYSFDSDDEKAEGDKEEESDSNSEESEDGGEEEEVANDKLMSVEDVLTQAQQRKQYEVDSAKLMICCVCLGDRSDNTNEIVECDGCGVTVHEGCYGVSENDSVSSTVSSCSTMPWFCEACRAGVGNPTCELCPNPGGIFKETDVGKWVHLVCALYIPGVAFGEVDKLSSVTLFEMAYSKWGAKSCQFCLDQRFTRTGVTVGCDAGMCRTYFHVTCGQREGLLSEAHSEEVDQADPFYAHCKLHSDKTLMRKRRRNWLALEMRTAQRKREYEQTGMASLPQEQRIQQKLAKYREKYATSKLSKPSPWVPTQKMARLLTSSASACRALWRKAALSGVDCEAWEIREAQAAALADVHRKWHIPPAFSVEFIGYYLDRNVRMCAMRRQLSELLDENAKLLEEQQNLQEKYDEVLKESTTETAQNTSLKQIIQKYHDVISKVAPNKKLPSLELLGRPVMPPQVSCNHHPLANSTGGVPTPAALKAGVGFPLGLRKEGVVNRVSLNNECGICHRINDQHLLAKCDTCYLYYHLGCLNPPLTRMPKKTKLMGWQCSECDKESSGSEIECLDPEAPRKLRHNAKDNGGDTTPPVPKVVVKQELEDNSRALLEEQLSSPVSGETVEPVVRSAKKRRREKHHRYSPEPTGSQTARPHKRKRKHKTPEIVETTTNEEEPRPALKICFKSIPQPTGEATYVATPGGAYQTVPRLSTSATVKVVTTPSTPVVSYTPQAVIQLPRSSSSASKKQKESEVVLTCDTCNSTGTLANLVQCDECMKGFHFACLDPPVKKSPKVRGYSWHCANCDPTETDSN